MRKLIVTENITLDGVIDARETANKGVRLSAIHDTDGNQITFIGNFRVEY